MITKEEAIQEFKSILTAKASWKILAKSQFVSHLAVFMSWCLRKALWAVERALQEFFLSTAMNESSIMTHAEDREYVPRKRTPASGSGTVTNNGAATVYIPAGQALTSDADIDYVTDRALYLSAGDTADVEFIQKSILTVVHTVTEEKAFYEILFDEDLSGELTTERASKICDFAVYVDNNDGHGYEPWTYSRLFQNAYEGDLVYDEFYTHSGKMGIRLGNDYVGTILPAGALIKIVLQLTEGDTTLAEGQILHLVGEVIDGQRQAADLAFVTTEAINNGQAAETISEMKQNLRYWPIYNEKLVWRDDYAFFAKRAVADILWIKVWGEEEAEAVYGPRFEFINKIFISAYAPDRPDLETEVMDAFAGVNILNRKFEWVDPVFVSFSLTITGKIARTLVIADAVTEILAVLAENYGKDSAARKTDVRIKDLYGAISETGYFDATGAYFEVEPAGTTEATGLSEMVHIDLDATVINLSYV